jgi:flagellar motility protein MotE (MotC chaperone)
MSVRDRYDELVSLRGNHPAWRLLAADNAPLILGFCERVFLLPNVRSIAHPDIVEALQDHIDALHKATPDAYPKKVEAYLADWSDPRTGWLRRSFPADTEVAYYQPTSAVETAAELVRGLGRRSFLGTASRLLTVRDLLRQIAAGAATDPEIRLTALQRQRAEIDAQIESIRSGANEGLDDTAIRERHDQAVATARELLADLREVEENFRELDRDVRRRATTWDGPRGEFLATVFGSTEEIGASDQGRSWRAFWEHLLSSTQQAELDDLLALLPSLPALADEASSALSTLLRTDLIVAAEATQRTVASLSAQLRAFLDEQTWSEGRRINAAIRKTLTAAMDVAADPSRRPPGAESTDLRADINLPLERPLYTPRSESTFDASQQTEMDADDIESALDELLNLSFIDVGRIRAGIEDVVADHGGIASLSQVLTRYPLSDGLAELVGYLQVAENGARIVGDDQEFVDWTDRHGRHRRADLPLILFEERDEDVVAESTPSSDLEGDL